MFYDMVPLAFFLFPMWCACLVSFIKVLAVLISYGIDLMAARLWKVQFIQPQCSHAKSRGDGIPMYRCVTSSDGTLAPQPSKTPFKDSRQGHRQATPRSPKLCA